jgi:MFS transporter, DHA2 family, methylenomycin A resistance protein
MTLVSTWLNGRTERTHPRLILIATSLGVLFAQIDTSVVNLAVKSIAADLHADVSEMQWVIDSYNLVYASLLLTGGTLGDLYGRRRIFVLGIVLFIAGTLVCALAPSAGILILGRIVSGLGAAFEVPMSLVLLTLAYPGSKERAHALGVWASCNGLAFIIGPILGGWLVDTIGWRSIFYLIVPICAAAVALTYVAIRESSEPGGRRLDLPGQGLAVVGLGAFAFAAIEGSHWGWTSPTIISISGIAVVALSLFIWVEARTPGPLLPLEFLRRPVFSATISIAGLMTFGMYALLFIMPLYFQTMRGASPFIAGWELLPMPISFFVVSQIVGYLNNQLGPRIVMTAGMTCMGVGALALSLINENTSLLFIELALLIVGIGLGLNTATVNGVAVAALPHRALWHGVRCTQYIPHGRRHARCRNPGRGVRRLRWANAQCRGRIPVRFARGADRQRCSRIDRCSDRDRVHQARFIASAKIGQPPRPSRNACGVVPVCLRKNRVKCEGSEKARS